jgi:[ribosomal protein S18]-alanine N-acetyltransferase
VSQARSDIAEIRVRRAVAGDLQRIVEIESRAYQFPWSEGIFRDCLRVGYPAWVVEAGGCLAGYGIVSVAAGESHVLNVCVDPAWQRLGLGRRLMVQLMHCARELGAARMMLEVRPSNTAARALYEQLGFAEIGLRPAYYPSRRALREDAMVLARELDWDWE